MYIYEGCRDSIHAINGDVYRKMVIWEYNMLGACKVGYKNKTGRKTDKHLIEIVHKYITQYDSMKVSRITGRSPRSIRDCAVRLGYHHVGPKHGGQWLAPGEKIA